VAAWLQKWLAIPPSLRFSFAGWDGDQDAFEQLYFLAAQQGLAGSAAPLLEDLERRAAVMRESGVVPLAITYLQLPLFPGPLGSLAPPRRLMAAAPLLHRNYEALTPMRPVYIGAKVRFLAASTLCSGPSPFPVAIEFDAGDGLGPAPIHFDEERSVEYSSPGRKRLVLKCIWGGHPLTATTYLLLMCP
jgi:hypothetical protein